MDQEQAQQITNEVNSEQEHQAAVVENTPAEMPAEGSARHPRLPAKFKDVDGVIDAYTNLEKKFGSTRKVEAPESYDVNMSKDYEGKWIVAHAKELKDTNSWVNGSCGECSCKRATA